MAEIFGVLIYAGFCFLCNKAGVQNNTGPVSANLLTIPINSNELPSGVIGDACNYERKTHNEAKAQKEMRENEARQEREYERILESQIRKVQEENILLPNDIEYIRRQKPSYATIDLLQEKVKDSLSRMVESIKPDTDTKRYVDNIGKYVNEFSVIYNGANKDYKDGKITWGECIKIKYEAKIEYDNDYWSARDNITRYHFKVLDAYDKGLIYSTQYNELTKKINEKCAYILTTNNVTVHQKPPAPAPVTITPTSPQPRVENGHVMSAQARVNAVNQVASVVSSGASAIGNAYIQGSMDMANTRRMEAQATQQLVSNVASAVGNGTTAVGNGFVNPSANSEQTNQVLNMVSNTPSAVDLCLSNPRGIGINIATGMLAEVNNSYNERSTTRNMVNGTIGAVGLVAGVVGAPTIATAIGGTALAVEGAELVNNMHNTIIERAPTEVRANMLSDSW